MEKAGKEDELNSTVSQLRSKLAYMNGQIQTLQRQVESQSSSVPSVPASDSHTPDAVEYLQREVDMLHTMLTHSLNGCACRCPNCNANSSVSSHVNATTASSRLDPVSPGNFAPSSTFSLRHTLQPTLQAEEEPIKSSLTPSRKGLRYTSDPMQQLTLTNNVPFVGMSRSEATHSLPLQMQKVLHLLRQQQGAHAQYDTAPQFQPEQHNVRSLSKSPRRPKTTPKKYKNSPSRVPHSEELMFNADDEDEFLDELGSFTDEDIARVLESMEQEHRLLGNAIKSCGDSGVPSTVQAHFDYIGNLLYLLRRYWGLKKRLQLAKAPNLGASPSMKSRPQPIQGSRTMPWKETTRPLSNQKTS